MWTPARRIVIVVAILVLLLVFMGHQALQAAGPIVIGSPTVENAFPDYFQASWPIQSDAGRITEVRGKLQVGRGKTRERITLEFTPGAEVVARWRWDTKKLTIAPYTPLRVWISAKDDVGNEAQAGPFYLVYEDNRFPWKERRSERLILRWYKGGDDFGSRLFILGDRALQRQLSDFGVRLSTPLVFLIYASEQDFFAWHAIQTEWVGGQAFPELGVATAIVPPEGNTYWIRQVIPHELLHLVMGQVITNPFGSPPAWFEEGMAQHYEDVSHNTEEALLREAVRKGHVLPLGVMRDPPGQDPEEAYLWYAQALSMVEWLLEDRGYEALRTYMGFMQKPYPPSRAFQDAFGMSEEAFYASWRDHIGLPIFLTPTPTATSTPSPAPSPLVVYSPSPTPTPSPQRFSLTPVPTASPVPSPVATPLGTPTQAPATPGQSPTATRGKFPVAIAVLLFFVFLALLGIIIGLGIRRRR